MILQYIVVSAGASMALVIDKNRSGFRAWSCGVWVSTFLSFHVGNCEALVLDVVFVLLEVVEVC